MYYVMKEDAQKYACEVVELCSELDITTLDYLKVRGLKAYTLEEAISLGATMKMTDGLVHWVGVYIHVRIDDHALEAWWLGKWRIITYWHYKSRLPSDKWVQAQLERTLRVNIPLHKETVIKFHW